MTRVYSHFRILLDVIVRFGLIKGLTYTSKLFLYKINKGKANFKLKLPGGRKINLRGNSSDIETFLDVFVGRQYDFAMPIEPKWIIDLGANIGLSSVFFRLKYPGATIVAVEPQLENYKLLQKNVADDKNIFTVQAAVWSHETELDIYDPGIGEWGFQVVENPKVSGGKVKGITLDRIMAMYGIREIDVLKVDIEGAEYQLFKEGNQTWLQNVKILAIELHENSVEVLRQIVSYDFHMYINGETLVFVNKKFWKANKFD